MFGWKLTYVFSCLNRSIRLLPKTKTLFQNSPSKLLQFRSMTIKMTPVTVSDMFDPKTKRSRDNTHIERTSTQFRQRGFFLTRIDGVREGTPSVKLIDLKLITPPNRPVDGLPDHRCEKPQLFTFKPGQWIDTYVPHLPKPGGFSFISTPKAFLENGLASLAIQNTDNPPSKWLWQDNVIGKPVMIRVGGNFTFPPSPPSPSLQNIDYLQFVAGGVGINPLISMLRYIQEAQVLSSQTRIVLHYLIRIRQDALFIDTLSMVKGHLGSCFDGHLWITRKERTANDSSMLSEACLQIHTHTASSHKEIGQPWDWWDSFSDRVLEHFNTEEKRERSLVYICGPQGLTDRLLDTYKEQGLDTRDGHIQVEKWW